MTTDTLIAEIEAALEKATPGPWEIQSDTWVWAKNPYGHYDMHVADVRGWGHLVGTGAANKTADEATVIQDANAAIIANARTWLPQLIAMVREMQRVSGKYYKKLAEFSQDRRALENLVFDLRKQLAEQREDILCMFELGDCTCAPGACPKCGVEWIELRAKYNGAKEEG